MGAIWMCARTLLRRRVLGTFAVVLLVGIAGGAVLTALAGARRTDSAFPRLLVTSRAADVSVVPSAFDGHVPTRPIERMPHVEQVMGIVAFGISPRPKHGLVPTDFGSFAAGCSPCPDIDRYQLLEGRAPNAGRVDEAVVNDTLLQRLGLHPGDVYRAVVFNFAELNAAPADADPARYFTPVDLRIVGVGRTRNELIVNENQDQGGLFVSRAFTRRFAPRSSFQIVAVKLRRGEADVAAFTAAVRRRFPDLHVDFEVTADQAATFERSVAPYVDALRLFALVAAVTGFLVVGQALVRLVALDARSTPNLHALGLTRTQLALTASARASLAITIGAVVAVLGALAASPLFPLGPARKAEPEPGLRLDGLVLGVGATALVVTLGAAAAFAAWHATRRARLAATGAEAAWHPSRAAERVAGLGGPASVVTGVRFALQRDRTTGGSSPLAALFGLVAAIATIGASLTFAANLDDLVTTPLRYGWTWDAMIDTYDLGATPAMVSKVRRDRDLAAVTVGTRGTLQLEGRAMPLFGFEQVRGDARPPLSDGRWPKGRDEVALGAATLRDLDRSVGETIVGRAPDGTRHRLRIVGRTLLPSLNLNGSYSVGEGAAVTARGLHVLDPLAGPSFFLVDLARGVSVHDVDRRYRDASALGPQRPGDIQSYARVEATPLVLAGMLTMLGIGVLAHLLVTSVRSRRRDLAVLKTLGFARRQIAATVAWQATTLILIALLLGLPSGLIAGRATWRSFANDLGVASSVVVPFAAFAGIVVAAVFLANLIAAFPARAAARTRAATVLRSE